GPGRPGSARAGGFVSALLAGVERLEQRREARGSVAADEHAGERARCAADPAYFLATHAKVNDPLRGPIPFELWPHLRDLLDLWRRERLTVCLKARQLGVSWGMGGYALWVAKFLPGANVLMLSKREDEAAKLLARAKFIEANLPAWLRDPLAKSNDSALVFAHGGQITALPSTEDAGRSEAATLVLLDEHAFHRYAASNYLAVKPTVDAGGSMVVVSTANGYGGTFAALWREAAEHQPRAGLD